MMKKVLLFVLLFSCAVSFKGQQKNNNKESELRNKSIRKQIVVIELENQIKNISFATVRVLIRYKTALWLWKDGKDDAESAEQIAVSAVDDLYENKTEIPANDFSSLRASLFVLLESNAKDSLVKLKEKYGIDSEPEADTLAFLLNQKNGEKTATDAAINSLISNTQNNTEVSFLILELQQKQSPELLRLLSAIAQAEQSGRAIFSAETFSFASTAFLNSNSPVELQKRFLKIVVDRSRNASQMPDGDVEGFYFVLNRLMPEILSKYREIYPEANIIQSVLKTRVSVKSQEAQEREDRIQDSRDKLGTLVSEAERTDDNSVKYELYDRAANLALTLKKFTLAVDLGEKTIEIELPSGFVSKISQTRRYDELLQNIAENALRFADLDAVKYAAKKITDPLIKSDIFKKTANYYFEQKDSESARYTLDECIKTIMKAEPNPQSISTLISIIPVTKKIDPIRVLEVNAVAANLINKMPSPDIEDKPQTENYKNYVKNIMIVNGYLERALTQLVKLDKDAVADLTSRIDKKEIKIVANFVLLTDSIKQSINQEKKNKKISVLTKISNQTSVQVK